MASQQEAPVVLVTGALTGIGHATAVAFAREGARLVVSGRHEKEGQALAAELRALGAEAEFVRADVRHEEEVRALVDGTVERFGRLDIAVNNAGTLGKPGPIVEQTQESYAEIFDTNVLGVLFSLKHEMRVMFAQRHGSIVNLSSVVGHVGSPNAAVYTASKHAVDGLTQTAALEAAPFGVRINGVAPGPIETPMLDRLPTKGEIVDHVALKRVGQPEEVAEVVKFVASSKASYVTGATVSVDGGQVAA
jgi:NAD(P)-dependent dehydrogenase (short-subunit alcohol dehydrogenase family)